MEMMWCFKTKTKASQNEELKTFLFLVLLSIQKKARNIQFLLKSPAWCKNSGKNI